MNKKGNILHISVLFLLFTSCIFLSLNLAAAQDDDIKVLFDETAPYPGNFFTINNIGAFGGSGFANLLQSNGYSVSRLSDQPVTPEKLQGYDVFVVLGNYRNYTSEEVTAINDYVRDGGSLFLVATSWGNDNGGANFGYNQISQSFGVSFENNTVISDNDHYLFFKNYVNVNDIRPSPITNNVSSIYFILGTYLKNPGNSTVVAYTDNDSYGDLGYLTEDNQTNSNFIKDTNESNGPFPVISYMEYGKGRVVFMGSSGSFINSMIYRDNVWILGLNTMNWLSHQPVPSSYQTAGIVPYNLPDFIYRIIATTLLGVVLIIGLFLKLRRDKKKQTSLVKIETIKNWKFRLLIGINAFFAVLAGIIFIPINFFLFDVTQSLIYDPNLGYALIIIGALYLFFMGVLLYNIITRQNLLIKYNYINLIIVLFFIIGVTVILADIFGFLLMQLLTIGGLLLLIPIAFNWWIYRQYGHYLIIEGKEFDRLEKLSANALLYEFRAIYTDLDYLGEGGFGRVFKAVNKEGQKVAIKIPKTFDKRAERTFITEVSNWSHLHHPNIVELYDFKILPIPYLETEYCPSSLKKELKPLNEAINIVYEVASGLKYAHNKNIIHGDIKFSNILIKDEVYKISDWGLSKLKTDESLSLSGATPSYAAPEQISHDFGKADERTDIYQLGIVFYALLTGRLPFKGEVFQIYTSTLTKMPQPPAEINANAGPVNDIIMKCLSKNKEDRFSSMEELIEALDEFIANETILFGDKTT